MGVIALKNSMNYFSGKKKSKKKISSFENVNSISNLNPVCPA
jgi:hypothetical protein